MFQSNSMRNKIDTWGGDKSYTVHSVLIKLPGHKYFPVFPSSEIKLFLVGRHIVNTNHFSAFKSTSSPSLNQSVIQTYSAQNERRYSRRYSKVYVI